MALKRFGPSWQRLRQVVLARDPYCKHPGCHDPSHDVDHIVPVEQGGKDELDNLQGLCHSHHSSKTASETGKSERGKFIPHVIPGGNRVTLVCGPPGAGKTTWVREQWVWGDLVHDLDALWHALDGGLPWYEKPDAILPFVLVASEAVLNRLRSENDVRHAWLILTLAKRSERNRLARHLHADVVVLETPAHECWRRMERDERRASKAEAMAKLSEQWWREYEPSEGEIVVRG